MMYVKSLRIQYSNDGIDWDDILPSKNYLAQNATTEYEFEGLSRWNETKDIWFEGPFIAYPFVIRSKQIRVLPVTWEGWPCMRLDAFYISS
jgi:hypothetical protein